MALGILRAGTFEIEGEVKYLTKASRMIGDIYIQLPGKPDPSTLYYGVWENVSDEYPGDFFRVEGGEALAFDASNSTEQDHAFQFFQIGYDDAELTSASGRRFLGARRWDNFNNRSSSSDWAEQQARSYYWGKEYRAKFFISSGGAEANTASETRSINRTIRVWERIS